MTANRQLMEMAEISMTMEASTREKVARAPSLTPEPYHTHINNNSINITNPHNTTTQREER